MQESWWGCLPDDRFCPTPAYSGKPLNAMVVLDTDGVIKGSKVIHHDEPILLIGILEKNA